MKKFTLAFALGIILIWTGFAIAFQEKQNDEFDDLQEQVTGDHIHVGYTCPEDELFELYNTYESRFNEYGKMFYLWQCFGDSDHQFWIKA